MCSENKMSLHDYYYDLPEELIAQDPLEDRSSSRFWRGITSILQCEKPSKKPKLPLKRMARVVCSGIRRAAENHCRWYSMPICCKKLWIAPPLL